MGQTALITGASRGIGRAIAKAMSKQGVKVLLLSRDEQALNALKEELANPEQAEIFLCDLTDSHAIATCCDAINKRHGGLSILVNNAGLGGDFKHVWEMEETRWEEIFNTNIKSAFLLSKYLLPTMMANGDGRVINIASVLALSATQKSSAYIASKHALLGFTKALAAELGPFGITCNAICPGLVDTPLLDKADNARRDYDNAWLKKTPIARLASADEVAELVCYLASDKAGFINGATIPVDGGYLVQG